MVTAVSNSLFDRLIDEFPPDRPYSRSDLEREPMPKAVSDYLKYMMRKKLRGCVAPEIPPQTWVDAQGDAVMSARRVYVDTLAHHQRIPAGEWPGVLRRACHESMRYLIHPAAALSDAVFDGSQDAVTPSDVFDSFEAFAAYPYFRDVIQAYFDRKGIARMDRDRLEGLVSRIDRQMTADYGAEEWIKLLQPLVGILGSAGYPRRIPVDLLTALLREKGADNYLARLRQRYDDDGHVPASELGALFAEEPVPVEESDGGTKTYREVPEVREQERGPIPLWKQFEQGVPALSEGPAAERLPSAAPAAPEPLWKQFRKQPEPVRSVENNSPLSELERSVLGDRGSRNRDLYVKHLFSGSRDEYEATLRKLQRAGSWSQASQIIAREVFLKHQVNIYSDPAVSFTDAAEAQFRS